MRRYSWYRAPDTADWHLIPGNRVRDLYNFVVFFRSTFEQRQRELPSPTREGSKASEDDILPAAHRESSCHLLVPAPFCSLSSYVLSSPSFTRPRGTAASLTIAPYICVVTANQLKSTASALEGISGMARRKATQESSFLCRCRPPLSLRVCVLSVNADQPEELRAPVDCRGDGRHKGEG